MAGRRRIDRILVPAYVEALEQIPLSEIRAKRSECEEEEASVSYERRLVQARLDILRAELKRRAEGGSGSIVDMLPSILGGERRRSRGAFPKDVAVPSVDHPRRRVEKLVSDDTLARVPELADDEIRAISEKLAAAERDVSELRGAVQRVMGALTAELARRYKTGEADPSDILSGR